MTARETLRAELLTSGLSDEVPLAEVETVINRLRLTKTTAERQELAPSTMRSLVATASCSSMGGRTYRSTRRWHVSLQRYVDQYDDPSAWVFSVWLKLTDAGKGVATALKDKVD